tara:strand:- start:271 stop:561 length:291 start_codon:yes stop_codon:yes gene_type:complete
MSRYKDTKKSESKITNKRRKPFQKYDTSYYQSVPKRNSDIYVITQEGDRLDRLAYQFYGDSQLWWFIARTNHLNTINVEAGTSLRIPASIDEAEIK